MWSSAAARGSGFCSIFCPAPPCLAVPCLVSAESFTQRSHAGCSSLRRTVFCPFPRQWRGWVDSSTRRLGTSCHLSMMLLAWTKLCDVPKPCHALEQRFSDECKRNVPKEQPGSVSAAAFNFATKSVTNVPVHVLAHHVVRLADVENVHLSESSSFSCFFFFSSSMKAVSDCLFQANYCFMHPESVLFSLSHTHAKPISNNTYTLSYLQEGQWGKKSILEHLKYTCVVFLLA